MLFAVLKLANVLSNGEPYLALKRLIYSVKEDTNDIVATAWQDTLAEGPLVSLRKLFSIYS